METRVSIKEIIRRYDVSGPALRIWRKQEPNPLPWYTEDNGPGKRNKVYFILEEFLLWIKNNRITTWRALLKKGFVVEQITIQYKDASGALHELR